jgi:serine/threonine protein kinase
LRALDVKHNKKIALKIVVKNDRKGEMLLQEYKILAQLKHENIVKIYQMINFSKFMIISMKLSCETVDEYYKRRIKDGNPLTDEECSKIAKGILQGLAYIHTEKNIIHRDIKPLNVLITS